MADTYKIYQLHDTPEYHSIRFSSMEENKNENLNINDYDLVYQGNISDFNSDFGSEYLLEEIYRKFNIDRPEDFKGYSLSMSDVVVTEINNEQKAYYCDRIGFQEMPEFFAEQKEKFSVLFEGGESTEASQGINFMQATAIDKNGEEVTLYAEISVAGSPFELDYSDAKTPDEKAEIAEAFDNDGFDNYSYPILKKEILEQANEYGISQDQLDFSYYEDTSKENKEYMNEILVRIEMNGEIETYKANGITAEEILNIAANSENPYSELMNLGQPISDLDYAVFQQSDKFTVSVDVNFDENEATIYTVNNEKGGIDEGNRTDDNVSFQYVKISDFKDLPNERKWIDYSANYDMKIDDEYIEGLTGKENLLANGGVFFRETERKNEFEYAAVIIEDNNTPFPCHGYINLDEYRDNEDFIQYAKEENMTVDELINTGTFAASWILENNTDEFVFTVDRNKDAGQFIDEMVLLENTDEKEISFDYETAFAEMLDTMEFSLVKYEDGSFGLHDYTGANLGNIEGDRFDNVTEIIDRLTYITYFEDYFFDDAEERIESMMKEGKIQATEIPAEFAEWKEFLEENSLTDLFYDVYQVSRLLNNYENIDKINLDNIPHEEIREHKKDSIQAEYG